VRERLNSSVPPSSFCIVMSNELLNGDAETWYSNTSQSSDVAGVLVEAESGSSDPHAASTIAAMIAWTRIRPFALDRPPEAAMSVTDLGARSIRHRLDGLRSRSDSSTALYLFLIEHRRHPRAGHPYILAHRVELTRRRLEAGADVAHPLTSHRAPYPSEPASVTLDDGWPAAFAPLNELIEQTEQNRRKVIGE
jgi:hypothetical protein